MAGDPDQEILLEIAKVGGAQQVRAVSGGDGLEVAFTAPASALKSEIERLARAKLAYVRRMRGGQGPGAGGPGQGKAGRGGIVA
jgi:hypothetical protein